MSSTTQVSWKLSLSDTNIILEELRVAQARYKQLTRGIIGSGEDASSAEKRHMRQRAVELERIIEQAQGA